MLGMGLPHGAVAPAEPGEKTAAPLRLIPTPRSAPQAALQASDLFRLCDVVAESVGAPVTIEDLDLNVLAFSDHRDVGDRNRTASILARRVPDDEVRRLVADGVVARLRASDVPVVVPSRDPGDLGRVAQRIRADEQTFGAIWVAVDDLSPDGRRRLRDLGDVAARHFLQQQLDADQQSRERSRRLEGLLAGNTDDSGLDPDAIAGGLWVMAVRSARRPGRGVEVGALELERLAASLRTHLVAVHPSALVAPVGDLVYAVVPTRGETAEARQRVTAAASRFTGGQSGTGVLVAIAGPVSEARLLPRARTDVDGVVRLRGDGADGGVVHADDVQLPVLMMELGGLVAERDMRLVGPVVDIAEHDRAHRSDLLRTLEAWLDAFGDVRSAADSIHVHPNTARYRLRKAVEVGGLDLKCPEARYQAMVQIRLMRATGGVA